MQATLQVSGNRIAFHVGQLQRIPPEHACTQILRPELHLNDLSGGIPLPMPELAWSLHRHPAAIRGRRHRELGRQPCTAPGSVLDAVLRPFHGQGRHRMRDAGHQHEGTAETRHLAMLDSSDEAHVMT